MEVNHFKCSKCDARMRSKNRPGSRQFPSGPVEHSIYRNVLESRAFGRVVPDPGNCHSTVDNVRAWMSHGSFVKDMEPNYYETHDYKNRRLDKPIPAHVQTLAGEDLELRLTMSPDKPNEPASAYDTIESLYNLLKRMDDLGIASQAFCYLSGGHKWDIDHVV